ncbi:MAG TPA: discoidin domain-containing protein [Thermoanaerobaculia bacterium]|nr:discoidin domain-containing protein [Thermoanaerobaculia bacterium]
MKLLLLAALLVLDDFADPSRWKVLPSDGIQATLSPADGALRLDFDFQGRAGYAVVRREIPLDLPGNYEIRFRVRGEGPPNNLEFKLVDPTGENVWWVNRRDFEPPREWTEVRIKKRHIQFAWGPAGGGEIRKVAAIELAVTAGRGGKGTLLVDDLTLRELPPERPYDRTPSLSASSGEPGLALDGDRSTAWRSGGGWIALDFLEDREYGGLVLDWVPGRGASRYEVQLSDDETQWRTVYRVDGGDGGRDYLFLPETESRHLRLLFPEGGNIGLAEIAVQPLAFSATRNAFFEAIARDAPRGFYPRGFLGEQSYWTVVGVDGDTAEAMLSEDGQLETGKGAFSVEPFLVLDGKLVTWADVEASQTLAGGALPIPSVTWKGAPVSLEVTAFAAGEPERSVLYARYRLRNDSQTGARPRLVLALRPFQVNPPVQFLNTPGGVATVRDIAWDGKAVTLDGRAVFPLEPPTGFGASAFDQGDITAHLAGLPQRNQVTDPFGHASAALTWDLRLAPGERRDVHLAIPLHSGARVGGFEDELAAVEAKWREALGRVEIRVPDAAYAETLRSNLAYILINRDGPGIQPGSRSYERSWIRDGALTSSALLRLGHDKEARDFLVWYAGHQFDDGKVPCCVDVRGADPVPENDSHGEFIHLAAEHFRYTGDRETADAMWPHVQAAVGYIDKLRQQRRTAEYRAPDKLHFFGLLPESISHEGYSDRPVHSYWDDFWALRGLNDAVDLAKALGKTDEATRWTAIRNEFRQDLHASLRRTIARHKIDYIPGSAEKGDYDPTSTSIGVAPGGELSRLPQKELLHTFERYWQESVARRDGTREWDAYTPYELRNLRTFLRLGWRERTHELLAFFMADRRPAGWNHWAEVVAREERKARFLGDMPHTWVGSEFIHAFLDLFAYTREDGALVLGAGLPPEWVEGEGVSVQRLRTEHGLLSYTAKREGEGVRFRIDQGITGDLIIQWQGRETVVRQVPADVLIR